MSGLFGQLDISASGMAAERLRMQVTAENLANANSTRGADGQPYRRKSVTLQEAPSFGDGARRRARRPASSEDPSPRRRVYDPAQPGRRPAGLRDAAERRLRHRDGRPDHRQRGYDANVQALNAAKQMFQKALDILR